MTTIKPLNLVRIPLQTPFANGNVNAYLLKGQKMTLVDTGMPGGRSLHQLKEGLQKEGLQLTDLDQILLTHLHTDHAGGVSAIQNEVDVPILVHERARRQIEGGESFFNQTKIFFNEFIEKAGAAPFFSWERRNDVVGWKSVSYLKEGDRILAGDREWQVEYVPGHSQTDLLIWDPVTGEAIVGDHLLKEISSNAFIEPPTLGDTRPKPLLQYRDSMTQTRQLALTKIYPGHGGPFDGHRDLIDQRFHEQETRCQAIRDAIETGHKTVYQISQALFPWLKDHTIFLGLSEVQGHLDLMLERSQVQTEMHESVLHYLINK